ncbi:nucleoporin NUP42-like [Plodia interpunctella]|uniref:nucleoporin NUP42-like n=1 Tax=Plodia interpunctella TaxID=58824 RepID=UPI002368B4C3|nr:nucleoporin NUP42-like [Plodia interpunctella]
MVVCKFFQQGCCRFGQNCKFEHIYGSKYTYHANNVQSQPQVQPSAVTDEQLLNQVQSDIQAALKGGQWLLSSYAPFKEKPVFPGIADLSPEEARLFIYEAKANNNLDQAVAYMNNMMRENQTKYEQLLQPTPEIIKVLRSIYKGEIVSSPFMNTAQTGFGNSSNASSIFRSAAQNTSVFGQPQPFGSSEQQQPFGSPNVFGQSPDNSAAKSIFAQASQNTFNQNPAPNNIFGSPVENTAAKSIFSQASQNIFGGNQNVQNQSIFGSPNQSVFAAESNAFGQQKVNPFMNAPTPSDPFKQSNASPFGQNMLQEQKPPLGNVFQQQTVNDPGVYSKMEDLSKEDMEAFSSEEFKLGFVPELPPPRELCF